MKKELTVNNIAGYLRHKNGCGYWKVPAETPHAEALKLCDCGYAEFTPQKFGQALLVDNLRVRIAKVCTTCRNGGKAYLTTEGYYHSKFGADQYDDFCDAYELWRWLKELDYINPHEESVPKTEAQAFFDYGLD